MTDGADSRHAPDDLDGMKVAAARLWATNRFPYLASAIFAAPTLPAPGLGRLVIDRWWRVHADPTVVAGASVDELGGELVHLASHLLRDHANRADAMALSDHAELHHWVDSADAEIADDFPIDLDRVSPTVSPPDLDAELGRLAEEYYRRGSVRDGMANDCGSGAHGQPALWEPPPPADSQEGLSGDDQELLRRRVASDIAASQDQDVSAGLRRWAEEQLEPTVDWRSELAALLRRAISMVSGAVDYSYARPSRRASALPGIVLPSLRRPTVEVAVVCDTSASVSDELLALALAEIDGLLRASGTRSMRVLACDDAVQATSRVVSVADVTLLGGGGTDLSVGIEAAMDHRPRPDLLVVLTDGYTPWPTESPTAHVVVGRLHTDEPVAPPDSPDWATTVVIGADGLGP